MTVPMWLLTVLMVLAVPGVVLGAFSAWFFVEWIRIFWLGKK